MTQTSKNTTTSPDTGRPGVRALAVLNAIVTRDQGPAGFEGALCIGVQHEAQRTWWYARFGRGSVTAFSEAEWPPEADAALLLGREEAEHFLVEGQPLERPGLVQFEGDARLMRRFTQRYLSPKGMIALRVEQSARRPS